MPRACKYELCSKEFEPRRPHQVFHSEACRWAQWSEEHPNRGENGAQRVAEHPLAEVRTKQEQSKEKAHWTLLVREQISATLLGTSYFHSDDLDPLGIPEQHRNIAGSQIGSYVSRDYMKEVGRRKSIKPSRKSAKSAIYKITEKGRRELSKLVGVKADGGPSTARVAFPPAADTAPAPPVSLDSGESSTEGRDQAQGPGGPRKAEPVDATPGGASPEPLSLLRKGPSMFDHDSPRAA